MNASIGELAFQGGKARAAALSPTRRGEIAKLAARARWGKAKSQWRTGTGRQDWQTPQADYDRLDQEFRFTLDAAASAENAKCPRYFDEQADGLAQPWAPERVFCNPPYAATRLWVAKALRESLAGALVVMLVPATTDVGWWHEHVTGKAEVRFVRKRLWFKNPAKPKSGPANFASAVVIYRPPVAAKVSHLRQGSMVWGDVNAAEWLPVPA